MNNYKVSLKKEKELTHKLRKAKVFKKDIKESFILASGPGGQKVNKTATCVSLCHIPSGIRVKSQDERTQSANRHFAYELLLKKINALREEQDKEQKQKTYKKRKARSSLRPVKIQEEVLKEKHIRSEKKNLRKKIKPNKLNDDI